MLKNILKQFKNEENYECKKEQDQILKDQDWVIKLLKWKGLNVCDKCLLYLKPIPHKNPKMVGSLLLIFSLISSVTKIDDLKYSFSYVFNISFIFRSGNEWYS